MSRTIKFRAWDKEEKCMIYDVQHTYDYTCSGKGAYEESFGEVLDDTKRYDVMEFVGFDKNKKDMYEGDIVIYEINCYGEQMGIVKWSNRHCGFVFGECNRRSKSLVTKTSAKNILVIGNIYENPEIVMEMSEIGYADAGALMSAT